MDIVFRKTYIIFFILCMIIFFVIFMQNMDERGGLFNSNSNTRKQQENREPITIITTGDIGLVRDVNYQIQQKNDFNYPFRNIAEYLRNADLTIVNLEGPLIDDCPIIITGFTFCGDSQNVEGMVYSGIDAANLSNNHTTNFGIEGLEETVEILRANNITPFGLDSNIEYITVKGYRIALVGFVELGNNWSGLTNATGENVTNLIRTAQQHADIVIAAFHWGVEYTHTPTENQRYLAYLAIDSGADLILGNHPHWIQPIEIYKNKIIVYAQGNTIFDQDWSQKTKEGVLYKFRYQNNGFEKIDQQFTVIENNSQPRFATDQEVKKIRKDLNEQ